MKIHDLDYLPVDAVYVVDPLAPNECGIHELTTPSPKAVSLYGHWVHVMYNDGQIESFPVSQISSILWRAA